VSPNGEFVTGFDVSRDLRSIAIGVQCPGAANDYLGESFDIADIDEIDLGDVEL